MARRRAIGIPPGRSVQSAVTASSAPCPLLATVGASLALAVPLPSSAEGPPLVCDAPTNEADPAEYRYQRFADDERCEGRVTVGVSDDWSPPKVRSAVYGTLDYDKGRDEKLYAAVSPSVGERVTLRGRSIGSGSSTYRLEAYLTPGEVFSWDLGLIRDIGPAAPDMAFLARLDDAAGAEGEPPIVPVRVSPVPFDPLRVGTAADDGTISLTFTADNSYRATVVDRCSGEPAIVVEGEALSSLDPLTVSVAGGGCRDGQVDLHVTDADDRTDRHSYELIR